MSTEIVPYSNGGSHTVTVADFTDEQISVIKNTIAKDCNTSELSLFIAACRRTRLDPFAKQIYAMKIGGKLNVTVSIDGARIIAERTGEYEGQEGPLWCGKDGVWKDAWLDSAPPVAARVIVFRKGRKPMVATARYAAYENTNNSLWKKMPEAMLAKCAEMLALRKAFPNDLSGIYSPEELDQAAKAEPVAVAAPTSLAEVTAKLKESAYVTPPQEEPMPRPDLPEHDAPTVRDADGEPITESGDMESIAGTLITKLDAVKAAQHLARHKAKYKAAYEALRKQRPDLYEEVVAAGQRAKNRVAEEA